MALKNSICKKDAPLVENLRKAQALILGKTNLSEWANFMSYPSSNGFSVLGGQTKNAYGKFDVGGSSSGSAVACALDFASVTIGTETQGSLIYPGSQNNLVVLKPTNDLVNGDLIIPLAISQDCAGPMAKNPQDLQELFSAMVSDKEYKNKLSKNCLDNNSLNNIKLCFASHFYTRKWYREDDQLIIQKLKKEFQSLDCQIFDLELDTTETKRVNTFPVMLAEFKQELGNYLNNPAINSPVKSLAEIVAFNKTDTLSNPYNQQILKYALGSKDSLEIIKLRENNQSTARRIIDNELKEVSCLVTLSNYLSGIYAAAGYPAVTFPAGFRANGEPVGVTLIAGYRQDDLLLRICTAYMQRYNYRKEVNLDD